MSDAAYLVETGTAIGARAGRGTLVAAVQPVERECASLSTGISGR